MLRSRTSRREEPFGVQVPEPIASREDGIDPEREVLLADSVGPPCSVLETLTPAERLAFVLHDMFAVPFDEIAPIVGRSPVAVRQLASRARRRVQGSAPVPDAHLTQQREVVDAFLAASRGGDFDALLALLDPGAVLRADRAAVNAGATGEVRGATAVADTFSGRARYAQPVLIDGAVGAMWAPGGRPRVVFGFTGRSPRSTWSLTPSGYASSTWRSSTTDEGAIAITAAACAAGRWFRRRSGRSVSRPDRTAS
jgi:RNA polymerase sigma-70 factor, ECF subfamily